MALFDNTSTPRWMSPGEFSLQSQSSAASIGNNFGSAFANAARMKEERRQFDTMAAARIQEMETMNTERQAQTASKLIDNKQKQTAIEEGLRIKAAQTMWMRGDTSVNPELTLPQSQEVWEKWKANTALGKSVTAENSLFQSSLSKLNIGKQEVWGLRGDGPTPSAAAWSKLDELLKVQEAKEGAGESQYSKLWGEYQGALKAGDTAKADFLKTKLTPKGMEIQTGYDDQGRAIFKFVQGGAGTSTVGDPTVATQTKAQESIIGLGKTYDLLSEIETQIRPEDLGIRGVAGELVIDRLLSQFEPEAANLERTDNRTKLKAAIQGMVRQISSDTRFSESDRKRAEEAAPSSGALESYPRAVQSIKTLKQIFADRARRDAEAAGAPIPDYAMKESEIIELFRTGKIDKKRANSLLQKYHGYEP